MFMNGSPLSPLRETRGCGCCGIYGCNKRMFQSLLKGTLELICSRMLWMLAYPLSPLRETRGFGCCGVYGYTKRMFQGLLKGTLEPNTHLPASTAWDSGANDLALSTDNFTRVKQNGSVYFKNI